LAAAGVCAFLPASSEKSYVTFVFWISGSSSSGHPGDNKNKNSPKAEPFVSASDGEV